eukprot:1071733-Pelagomonas_calceolata.AAC.1
MAGDMQQRSRAQRWTGTVSGRDHLIPLGRRHTNSQPAGPHPFDVPKDNELLALVSTKISSIETTSSFGFDAVPPTFIKCAFKRMPKQHGRGCKSVNVMAPHIAAMFRLFITKAHIPSSWKEAKLTPIHKKGLVTDPGNYRMIAVSGTLYRLCSQHNKIPDTQFVSTPAIAHCNPYSSCGTCEVRLRKYKRDHHECTLLSLTSSKHMTPSQGASCRNIYKTYTLLDGDKRVNVQPSFGVRQGCRLSPLLFSIYLSDSDCLAEGVQGARTGIPDFMVAHLMFADDLSLSCPLDIGNDHTNVQTMLNKLKAYAERKSLTVNTLKSE